MVVNNVGNRKIMVLAKGLWNFFCYFVENISISSSFLTLLESERF